jgi:hypothetical protein
MLSEPQIKNIWRFSYNVCIFCFKFWASCFHISPHKLWTVSTYIRWCALRSKKCIHIQVWCKYYFGHDRNFKWHKMTKDNNLKAGCVRYFCHKVMVCQTCSWSQGNEVHTLQKWNKLVWFPLARSEQEFPSLWWYCQKAHA